MTVDFKTDIWSFVSNHASASVLLWLPSTVVTAALIANKDCGVVNRQATDKLLRKATS